MKGWPSSQRRSGKSSLMTCQRLVDLLTASAEEKEQIGMRYGGETLSARWSWLGSEPADMRRITGV